jgi:DamX protein
MAEQNQQNRFITPELTHRSELILHLLEYSNKLVLVKGEPDAGKTTFFEELIDQQESNLIIRNLTLSITTKPSDVFKAIIDGSSPDELQTEEYTQADLNQWLTRCQNKQEIPALLIDNADLFDDVLIKHFFEVLKNSNENSALHVCLFCEASFLQRLEEFGLNQDDSDNLHIVDMPSLTEKQTEQYIHSHYPSENSSELNLFDEKTIKQIHRISHGLPGRVNALCEQYLDDPAKKDEIIEEKSSIDIKAILLKNKSVLIVGTLLLSLSISVATILNQTEKEDAKQTIKLDLPKQIHEEEKQEEIVEVEVPQELEPEPITVDELSPPVIPEIANDINNKTEVIVYNPQGHIVAKESELEPVVIKEEVVEEIIEETIPPTNTIPITETIAEETIPAPEPEPVKAPEPVSEAIGKDIKWLVKQGSNKYVLQLIGAYEQETIDIYLKTFKNNDDKVISFTASNKGKEWHVLVYGLYENRDQAVAAIETLPTKAKLMAPWPRSVKSIKDLLQ